LSEGCVLPKRTEINEFADGETLVDSHTKNPFDIIFLDIQMSGITGIEAGQRIRNIDRCVIIIYLTSYKQHVFNALKMEIFDYIIKPVSVEKINDVLNRAIAKHMEQHYIININWRDTILALDVCNVVFLEVSGRFIKFTTLDNHYYHAGKLEDYEKSLAPYGFIRCHQRCLVNMKYINSIESSIIITKLGHNVPMSVRKKKDCLSSFIAFSTKYMVSI